jgi:hypothetical protein
MAGARLRFPRFNPRLADEAAQPPLSPGAALVRDRIALRRQDLDDLCPRALDLAAEATAALHGALHGDATAHRGDRSARYFRGQLTGENAIAVEDLCRLVVEAPAAVAAALRHLARAAGYRLEPLGETAGTVATEGADVSEAAGKLAAALMRAIEDGQISLPEAEHLEGRVGDLKSQVAELEAALARTRRKP